MKSDDTDTTLSSSPELDASESSSKEKVDYVIAENLDEDAQKKLEVIQSLLEPCDRNTYGEKLRDGAEKLGCSVRTVQRMVKRWEVEGVSALVASGRADQGKRRISSFWQDFIIKTYEDGNKDGKRMKPKQVAIKVESKAKKIGDDKPPSYKTVLRLLSPIIERKKKAKSIRSPGWHGSTLVVKTRDGEELGIEYSNHTWQCDHTAADVLLVDKYGEPVGRPWLTIVIDSYSRCVMGVNVGFDAPSSQVVALALRHAILTKKYGPEYKLHCEWGTYGKPDHFFTDGGRDFRSNHVQRIGVDLGFSCHLRDRPSEGGIVERVFRTLNDQLFSTLPGYTGSSVQQRPEEADKEACLTLRELEHLIVRFICDNYNQTIDARMGDQTRFQRWEAGLPDAPELIDERHLDVCLMKASRRTVQRGGHLQFENLMFRGEYLAGYAGETVSLRFDPSDITTVWVYRQEGNREVFLTRAYAQGLETEQLSYEEAKASSKRLRAAGKAISNDSILQESIERDALLAKKDRKQRRKAEQTSLHSQKLMETSAASPDISDEAVDNDEKPEVEVALDLSAFEPIDFDDIRGAW